MDKKNATEAVRSDWCSLKFKFSLSGRVLNLPMYFFLVSALYSASLSIGSKPVEMAATALYVLALALGFLFHQRRVIEHPVRAREVVGVVLALAFGLLIPTTILGTAESFYWAVDSQSTHVPKAIEVSEWMRGNGAFPFDMTLNTQGALTQFWIGLLFAIFGKSPIVTVMGLAAIRVLTCLVLIRTSRLLFGTRDYDGVYLLYAIYPNALYHTTVYFKEASVHLFVALAIFSIVQLFKQPRGWSVVWLACWMLALFTERFYLVMIFLPLIVVLGIRAIFSRRSIVGALAMVSVAVFIYVHPYFHFSPEEAMAKLKDLRRVHSAFPEINVALNYDIPYALAVIKSVFTPFWTVSKLDFFKNFESLITWGAPLGQLITLGYFLGVWRAIRNFGKWHILMQMPFVLFLLPIAYISPWAGRVRDSLCPLIILYSAFCIIGLIRERCIVSSVRPVVPT